MSEEVIANTPATHIQPWEVKVQKGVASKLRFDNELKEVADIDPWHVWKVEVVKCASEYYDKIILHINGEQRDTFVIDEPYYYGEEGMVATLLGNWGTARFHKYLLGDIKINH